MDDHDAWLSRVVLVANKKGGVGKSSTVGNLAVEISSAGYRVLVIDADQQGNVSKRDLGATVDDGVGLTRTFQFGDDLSPAQEVRPGLDVVAGGPYLGHLTGILSLEQGQGKPSRLRPALARLVQAERYDLVLIDSGPGDMALLDSLLRTARWLIVTTTPDEAAMDGVEDLAERFAAARRQGSQIELLGALLFGVNPRATARNASVLGEVRELLGGVTEPFETVIRWDQATALDSRRRGIVARELAPVIENAKRDRLASLRKGTGGRASTELYSRRSGELAGDYAALAREVMERLVAHEAMTA